MPERDGPECVQDGCVDDPGVVQVRWERPELLACAGPGDPNGTTCKPGDGVTAGGPYELAPFGNGRGLDRHGAPTNANDR